MNKEKELIESINKKESEAEFLADLKKAHEVYAQSVYQLHNNIIHKNIIKVKAYHIMI